MTYRPTTLRLASEHCPRAIDYYAEGGLSNARIFQAGIAAHEILADIGHRCVAHKATLTPDKAQVIAQRRCEKLLSQGRLFEGRPEPPMHPESVFEGRDLALAYAFHPDTVWPTEGAHFELGTAFDREWGYVPYDDPSRRFRLIFDRIERAHIETEDSSSLVVTVTDYKSAWPTDASELDTIQMRAQAATAWLLHPDVDCIRRTVVNLRTLRSYSEELWINGGGREVLDRWRRDLATYMDALDAMIYQIGTYPRHPGAGCLTCPFAAKCLDDAPDCDADSIALRYARLEGARLQLSAQLRSLTKETRITVTTDDHSFDIGYFPRTTREPRENAAQTMFAEWRQLGGDVDGFLRALRPGMSSLESVAKTLFPGKEGKEQRQQSLELWSQEKPGSIFELRRASDPQKESNK